MSEENVEIARRATEAFNRSANDYASFFAEDAEFRPITAGYVEGRRFRGPDGVRRYFRERAEFVDEVWVEVDEYRNLGKRVLALGRWHIRGKGSGIEMTSIAAWLIEFEDRESRSIQSFATRQEALEAAGLSE